MSSPTSHERIEIVCELEAGSELLPELLWSLVNAGVEVHEYSLMTGPDAPVARFVTDDPDEAERILIVQNVPTRRVVGPVDVGEREHLLDRLSKRFAAGAERLEVEVGDR